jgi:hypothetical protein
VLSFSCGNNACHFSAIIIGISQAGQKTQEEKAAKKEDDKAGPGMSTNHNREENNQDTDKKTLINDTSSGGTHTDKAQEEHRPNCADDQKSNRPMSPGTLALMCDEQDTMFTTSQNAVPQETVAANQNRSELYAEQERCVLTEFRDCLRKLVTCGRMKGTPIFPLVMLIVNIKSLHMTISYYFKQYLHLQVD